MKTRLFLHFLFLVAPLALQAQTVSASAPSSETAKWFAAAEIAPDFKAPATLQAWEQRRPLLQAELWQLLGKLPPRPKVPAVTTLSREERETCFVEKFQFDNGAGATVPGYLLLPKNVTGKAPAILYCHWHGGEYDIGKEELFKSAHTPEIPAVALTKRGYAVIAIDAYCFGERNGKGPGGPEERGSNGEMTASKFNLWAGRTLWGMILRDDLMALDYLASRPEVDSSRLGVTGISMGATRSWWLMALDQRLKAGVAVCCLTRYQDLIAIQGLKYHGIYYFVPGLLNHFDTEAIIACVAPRPLLCLSGEKDFGSPVDGIRKIEAAARPVYALYGQESSLQSEIYPNVGHEYTRDMWEKMLKWMGRHLQNDQTPNPKPQ